MSSSFGKSPTAMATRRSSFGCRVPVLAAALVAACAPAVQEGEGVLAFRDVRLFDGGDVHDAMTVLVEDGVITAVGAGLEVPAGAEEIDGNGRTLLPGLIDAHVHAFGPVLRTALVLGVTTELDMFTEPGSAAVLRDEQERGEGRDRADLFSAGYLVTAPDGHGTEYGLPVPTLERAEDADAFVQARIDEGSDYIKVIYDGGSAGRTFPTLDLATLTAVIEAAHARGRLAVVHVAALQAALEAVAAGADGLMHVFYDTRADVDSCAMIADSGAFVVPTLAVLESVSGGTAGAELLADPRLAEMLGPSARSGLDSTFPSSPDREQILARALDSVRCLHEAGVPILAGTDAPNPGTWHGASMHRELELLVRAGLPATSALHAATAAPAAAFSLSDRGRIEPGARADLLLVRGDPIADITVTRDIIAVWKRGVRVDRDAVRREVATALAPPSAAPADSTGRLVSDFDSGSVSAEFGAGWMISTDEMLGGASTAEMRVVPGLEGANGGVLEVTGTIAVGGVFSWAGPMFSPGQSPFAPADLSAQRGLRFRARGDGRTYALLAFSTNLGQQPAVTTLVLGSEWREHRIPFTEMAGINPAVLQAVLLSGAGAGEFRFEVDEIGFY